MDPATLDDDSSLVGDLLTTLANHRRRILIRLVDENVTVSLRSAAAYIALVESENGVSCPKQVRSDQRRSVRVTLYQNHVPKLRETSILTMDERQNTLSPGANFGVAVEALRCVSHVIN